MWSNTALVSASRIRELESLCLRAVLVIWICTRPIVSYKTTYAKDAPKAEPALFSIECGRVDVGRWLVQDADNVIPPNGLAMPGGRPECDLLGGHDGASVA